MGTLYWEGRADAVAQVGTFQVTAYDVATTYNLIVGGVTIATTIAQGSANATASALSTNWNASTHPYATGVTASVATDTVTLTADTAGVPFVATSSAVGGTGTIGAYSATTASAGPNDWSTADNWDTGAIPVNSDDVIIQDSDVNIMWGLDQNGVSLTSLTIKKTFTGKIGLDYTQFATSANGETFSATKKAEYRQGYLKIISTSVDIGEHYGSGAPNGSGRIKLDLHTTASTCTIHDSATSASDTGRGAVQLLAANASTTVHVRNCPGGLNIASGVPGETSTIGTLTVGSDAGGTPVHVGIGTTITTANISAGNVLIEKSSGTVTTLLVEGGTVTTEGSFVVTTGNVYGGELIANHISGTVSFTTMNIDGGKANFLQSREARTVTTCNFKNGTLDADSTVLTITTLNEGDSAPYSMTIANV